MLAALALTLLLVFALTRNPVWGHLDPDLPVSLNLLAAMTLGVVLGLGFLIPRQPLLVGGIVTAGTLAFATYPWSELRWEVAFIRSLGVELTQDFINPAAPGVRDWAAFAAPVLFLVFIPVILQVRAISDRYQEKGANRHEIDRVRRHLLEQAAVTGAITLGVVALLGILLRLAVRLPAGQALRDNPLVVLLLVTLLLLSAIVIGTGLYKRPPRSQDPPPGQRQA